MVVFIDVKACVQYGICVEECPAAAISLKSVTSVNAEDFVRYGIDVYPSRAITLT
ncbi:MAG: ferredoxin [Euryarchaeota archaeon]